MKTEVIMHRNFHGSQVPNDAIISIATQLNSMNSIEKGMDLLKKSCKYKADLQNLANYLDISFTARDTIATLRHKIIESTIAYRTRSEAIRGQ